MSALNIWVLLTCWFPSYDPILRPGTSAWLQYLLKTAVSSECFPLEVLPGVCPKKGVPAFVFSSDFSVFSFYPLFRVKSLYCAEICLCHASYKGIYNIPVLAPGSSESCHSRLWLLLLQDILLFPLWCFGFRHRNTSQSLSCVTRRLARQNLELFPAVWRAEITIFFTTLFAFPL